MKLDIPYLIANLSIEEKAGLCSGADFWHTKAVERLGLPAIMVSDGPHGLRKQNDQGDHVGINDSIKSVCFPAGSAMASSFDRDLISNVGTLLAEEARAEKVHTLLGPAINIKRSPLCGRNFEYLSEDPYLAGELSASYVAAVQASNVGVSVKHYAANNQEHRRMSVDSLVDERTLREIYLKAFETTVRKSKPWTIMCAYNKINGTYCCENKWLLTDVLRDEWGFDGIVMTDWGAMNERVDALIAGLDLEMPSSNGLNDKKIVAAIEAGELPLEILDRAVEDLLVWIERGLADEPAISSYDKEAHHEASRKTAAQCAVLLKNDGDILPLNKNSKIAFIGPFASAPRFQGGGSSHINTFKVTSALEACASAGINVSYAAGIAEDGITADNELLKAAVEQAGSAEVAVIFAGLPDSFESEGYDRSHMDMPQAQNELISAIAAVQPNTVVVLHKGSPITMPWINEAAAVLDMYLGGQAVGAATADLLFGDANPSGKLAETFPLRLEDTPCYLQFPGDGKSVTYGEGVYVGYRWYDSKKMDVLFPFGYGLSYTNFSISDLMLSSEDLADGDKLEVSVKVTNTGKRPGSEVVQVYIAPPAKLTRIRPVHELKGFEKVYLEAGETKTITIKLDVNSFAYWSTEQGKWFAAPGIYEIQVGNSSRNMVCKASIELKTAPAPFKYSASTTFGDLIEAGMTDILEQLKQGMTATFGGSDETPGSGASDGVINSQMMEEMMAGMPIHALVSFTAMPDGALEGLINLLKQRSAE